MYTLVLMTALTPGADVTPAPVPVAPAVYGCSGIPAGCTGCNGFVTSYGCSGSCYGCSGCYGSCTGTARRGHGLFGHHKRSSCHGCSGYSCSGYNCFGSSCMGFGGCTGFGGCAGCVGFGGGASSWGPPVGMPPYTLHGYNQGGAWGYGPPVVYADPHAVYGRVTNLTPATTVVPAETSKPMTPPTPPKGTGANIKFRLPADAKLYVDGKLTMLTGTERAFSTPGLEAGQKFFYDVKAELMVDGKPVVEEKRVVVEAGSDLVETFPKLLAAAPASGNPVAGK
jgi:uncharacterized protein (TIGR03000 family)